jgi:hypothetical protein
MTSAAGILLTGLLVLGPCAEPDNSTCSWSSWFLRPHCPSCPDDYCPKNCPPPPPWVTSREPDDYCPKRLPCLTEEKCFVKAAERYNDPGSCRQPVGRMRKEMKHDHHQDNHSQSPDRGACSL